MTNSDNLCAEEVLPHIQTALNVCLRTMNSELIFNNRALFLGRVIADDTARKIAKTLASALTVPTSVIAPARREALEETDEQAP